MTAEVENEPNQPKKTDMIQVEVHKNVLALIPDHAYISIVTGSETDLPKVKQIYTDGEETDFFRQDQMEDIERQSPPESGQDERASAR